MRRLSSATFALIALSCGGQTAPHDSSSSGGTTGDGSAGSAAFGGSGGSGGSAGSAAGGSDAGDPCTGPNPAGCVINACPPNMICDPSVGCVSSSCTCTEGGWACTDDCGGGTCVAIQSEDCKVISDVIAAQTAGKSCTSVVRIGYTTDVVTSYAIVCGSNGPLDEATARAIATADSGYGDATLISGSNPPDEWIFYKSPGDFGGVSIVSARAGVSVFGGSIIWMGAGEVLYPKSWQTASLGQGCAKAPAPTARGFDLNNSGKPLPGELVEHAIDTVWSTGLPIGLWQGSKVLDVVVLFYPPSQGWTGPPDFDPKTAETIVLINSGL